MKFTINLIIAMYITGVTTVQCSPYQTYFIGIIDRIEEEQAVILIENLKKEIILPVKELEKFAEDDTWLLLHFTNKTPEIVGFLDELKYEKMIHIHHLMEKLQEKAKASPFNTSF